MCFFCWKIRKLLIGKLLLNLMYNVLLRRESFEQNDSYPTMLNAEGITDWKFGKILATVMDNARQLLLDRRNCYTWTWPITHYECHNDKERLAHTPIHFPYLRHRVSFLRNDRETSWGDLVCDVDAVSSRLFLKRRQIALLSERR